LKNAINAGAWGLNGLAFLSFLGPLVVTLAAAEEQHLNVPVPGKRQTDTMMLVSVVAKLSSGISEERICLIIVITASLRLIDENVDLPLTAVA
jgi:hypothetical protein